MELGIWTRACSPFCLSWCPRRLKFNFFSSPFRFWPGWVGLYNGPHVRQLIFSHPLFSRNEMTKNTATVVNYHWLITEFFCHFHMFLENNEYENNNCPRVMRFKDSWVDSWLVKLHFFLLGTYNIKLSTILYF